MRSFSVRMVDSAGSFSVRDHGPVSTEPTPPSKPSRAQLRVRDMVGAMVFLVVIALIGGGVRSCSFAPAGPTIDPAAGPTVDAPAQLAEFARASAFPLRVPTLPDGWRANSTDRGPVADGGTAVRVGYLAPSGRYLRLVQSDAAEEGLVRTEAGGPLQGTGVVQAGGLQWVVYQVDGGEPFRVTTSPDGVRWLVTGSADDADFQTLADAVARGRVLPAAAG
ncbi:Protein of unknown function [Pseudonocardia oroxyli]|uniref:DUF4245 domain-containing protein n=1 Tax=Pseudonocardia oroxyli TaxID=366584 RepID=A0A1G7QFT5_PSEOR|nr:Protein of unknown function [Pseudonocardia oroxyli]